MILFSDLSRLCNYLSSASPFNPLSTFGSELILCLTLNSKINYRVREYCSSNDRVLIYIENRGIPILSTPNEFALLSFPFSVLMQVSPGLFHHLSYSIWISPFSCSSRIAREILSRQGEPVGRGSGRI